jgi:GTP pyrophosphokinase
MVSPTLAGQNYHADQLPDLETWLARLSQDRSEAERELLASACLLSKQIYQDKLRVSGDSYLSHICTVVDILADLRMDAETLAAAMLHDAVMQNLLDMEAVRQRFGGRVEKLIQGAAKMASINDLTAGAAKSDLQQTESLRKMLLAVVEDVRVVCIKLAERLHDMRVLRQLPEHRQRAVALETQEIFAPLANRLGIWHIKWELEDLALRYLKPEAYQEIAKALDAKRSGRQQYIHDIMQALRDELSQAGIQADITGRPKHIYSIWRKMQRKGVDFSQIYDALAVRVLVPSVPDCYHALGVVHSLWKPIPQEFDDYIARPKPNGYRSLHTAVEGPEGKNFEVQIRTQDMHQHAELGVASHWRYKEGAKAQDKEGAFEEKIAWLRQLLAPKDEESGETGGDFLDRFKSELFEDRVYVLSPEGRIVDLPQGATPIDFAYAIHTSLGHRCRGAKINGRITGLNHALKTGERLEILAASEEHPNTNWLNEGYVKTSRARNKIKHWLNQQNSAVHIAAGRALIERELRRLNLADTSLESLAQTLEFKNVEEFLKALGKGDTTSGPILQALKEKVLPPAPPPDSLELHPSRPLPEEKGQRDNFAVQGMTGLLTTVANCCKPLPADPVIGYISRERGVVVHRRDCPNALHLQEQGSERLIEVEWTASLPGKLYPVDIEVDAYDRTGLLRDVSQTLAEERINITAANTLTGKDRLVKIRMTIEVRSVEQLSRALLRLENLTNVIEVARRASRP